jgi:hypothetical protein
MRIKIELIEEMLGTASANPEIHREFIASKSPEADTIEDEVASIGVEGVIEKGMTVFPRHEGFPFVYDYQIKGFFKDSCSSLGRVPGMASNKLKAYKKVIDGTIFVAPRKIKLVLPPGGLIGSCQRPLRAETAQGPRIALANSETVPAGTLLEFDVICLDERAEMYVREWLDYGKLRGLGQWRNSGKGRFTYEEFEPEAKAR